MGRRTRTVIMGAGGRDFHTFNMLYRDDPAHKVVAFTAAQIPGIAGRRYPPTLAGPLCTGLDRLGRAALPPLAAGDLVCFGSTGAYGATEAMSRFLSHPPAREICLEERELRPR